MLKPTMHAAPVANSLAVTYRCIGGHHDIRFYRAGPVPYVIACASCGEAGIISLEEHDRHKRLLTPLAEWLVH